MTPKKAKDLLPKEVRPILQAIPSKHWEEFAMVWMFHDRNRALMLDRPELKYVVKWLAQSRFGAEEGNIRIVLLYVNSLMPKDKTKINVERIVNAIIDYYDNL